LLAVIVCSVWIISVVRRRKKQEAYEELEEYSGRRVPAATLTNETDRYKNVKDLGVVFGEETRRKSGSGSGRLGDDLLSMEEGEDAEEDEVDLEVYDPRRNQISR
jgi:hypothetical protein